MIPFYLSGESYAITLPGDRDPKTIFHVLPIRPRDDARRDALQAFLIGLKQRQAPAETARAILTAADQVMDNDIKFYASRVVKIESPWPAGEYTTIEGEEAIAQAFEAIGDTQYKVLKQVMADGNLLRELTFRRDPPSVAGVGKQPDPQGDGGAAEPAGDRHVRLPSVPEPSGEAAPVLLAGSPATDSVG